MDLFLFKKVVISLFTGYSSRNLSLMRGYDALTVELEQKPGGMGWGGGVIEREREGIWPADYTVYWGTGVRGTPSTPLSFTQMSQKVLLGAMSGKYFESAPPTINIFKKYILTNTRSSKKGVFLLFTAFDVLNDTKNGTL